MQGMGAKGLGFKGLKQKDEARSLGLSPPRASDTLE